MNRTNILGTIAIAILAGLCWYALIRSHEEYKGNLVPDSADPCSPNASRPVKDTQNSEWPIRRRPEDRCPPGVKATEPQDSGYDAEYDSDND